MDPGLLLGEQEGPEVFHKQHQTHLVNGGRAEAEAEVKGTCRNVNGRSEEHTSELQSLRHLVCRLLLDTATTEIYTLSLHDALPIYKQHQTHLVNGGRAEAEAEVKGTCRNVNGLHEHSSDANGVRSVVGREG